MGHRTFTYPPTPMVLQWLATGQLANRLLRSVRLWVILDRLYGTFDWANELPTEFNYPPLRDRLFSSGHSKSERLSVEQLEAHCQDKSCICHRTLQEFILTSEMPLYQAEWCQQVIQMTGLTSEELENFIIQKPFATVHRSLRDDLHQLVKMGWLKSSKKGYYICCASHLLPTPPTADSSSSLAELNSTQIWQLLQILEAVSFVQPNLEVVASSLWENLTTKSQRSDREPTQRVFLHLDYILSGEEQDRVDTYQDQLEQLWQQSEGGVVQFDYWASLQPLKGERSQITVTVYPVCLHYLRRAKYLSAYGLDPKGKFGWHNYRLDRIASERLKVLAWGDPQVPKPLQKLRRSGELPTPEDVRASLDEAWGFNFYHPRELLIMRFPPDFARWYVDGTVRHSTFKSIGYSRLIPLINARISDFKTRQELIDLIENSSPTDRYYQAWIRLGDINVLMRLRQWRPNGEVIAPLSVRQQLIAEATAELSNYHLSNPNFR